MKKVPLQYRWFLHHKPGLNQVYGLSIVKEEICQFWDLEFNGQSHWLKDEKYFTQ